VTTVKAGVLALQGDFREHALVLEAAGATPVEVRTPGQLAEVACLVLPGGESTTIGMIVLAERVEGGEPLFALMDIGLQRNAYGRQVESFEADLDVRGIDHPVRGVFIRAPRITDVGEGVEVLAEYEGAPVVLEQGNLLVASFHPELVGETALHDYLLRKV
jgi:5'-phosphate synthase pdxT subunit